jgi:hypothetical protein
MWVLESHPTFQAFPDSPGPGRWRWALLCGWLVRARGGRGGAASARWRSRPPSRCSPRLVYYARGRQFAFCPGDPSRRQEGSLFSVMASAGVWRGQARARSAAGRARAGGRARRGERTMRAANPGGSPEPRAPRGGGEDREPCILRFSFLLPPRVYPSFLLSSFLPKLFPLFPSFPLLFQILCVSFSLPHTFPPYQLSLHRGPGRVGGAKRHRKMIKMSLPV